MIATQVNRLSFSQGSGFSQTSSRIALAVREQQDLAVMLVNVHGVERLCASRGHVQAGELLDEFFKQLQELARKHDTVERISDCKFAVLLDGLRNPGHVSLAAQKIERIAQQMTSQQDRQSALKISIGVVLCPEQGDEAGELLRSAEIASLDARKRNESLGFYAKRTANELFMNWDLEGRLTNALESGGLDLHYQPKMSLSTNKVVSAEALMRWQEPEIGNISPDVFIDLAESTGQIVELTHFAIQRACWQLSEWKGLSPKLSVAVNISPMIIQSQEIVDTIKSATSIWGVSPERLVLEVTETALMSDPEKSHEVLTKIREYGSRISIDDFGTGYSSLAYLKDVPADELKIDRSFVMGMLTDIGDRKLVEHSVAIAKSFGLVVVAEGVEKGEMLDELRELGCDFAQGYFICKPVPAPVFETFCRDMDDTDDSASVKEHSGEE